MIKCQTFGNDHVWTKIQEASQLNGRVEASFKFTHTIRCCSNLGLGGAENSSAKLVIILANDCNPAIGGSLVGREE